MSVDKVDEVACRSPVCSLPFRSDIVICAELRLILAGGEYILCLLKLVLKKCVN